MLVSEKMKNHEQSQTLELNTIRTLECTQPSNNAEMARDNWIVQVAQKSDRVRNVEKTAFLLRFHPQILTLHGIYVYYTTAF